MSVDRAPVLLDLGDLDAVGVATDVVLALRRHAIESAVDAVATLSAPDGWHRVLVTARASGHLVLAARYAELSPSRLNNVAEALGRRGWQDDEDREGATRVYPPGTEAGMAAFELLDAVTVGGAPATARDVTAVDGDGTPVPLD